LNHTAANCVLLILGDSQKTGRPSGEDLATVFVRSISDRKVSSLPVKDREDHSWSETPVGGMQRVRDSGKPDKRRRNHL
jgi:hypothetical protein